MKRFNRILFSLVHDGLMAALAPVLALYLRVGPAIADYDPRRIAADAGLFLVLTLVALRFSGLYRGIWRYASINDLVAIVRAASGAVLVFTLVTFQLNRLEGEPRSTPVIAWLILIMLLSGPRIAYRLFKDRRLDRVFERDVHRRVPVLLVGAGDSAELFIREMRRNRHASYDPVGILSVNDGRVGRTIRQVPVLGTLDRLAAVVERLEATDRRPQRLVVTVEEIPAAKLGALVEAAASLGLALARMPQVGALQSGLGEEAALRPIAVEDLLFRPQRALDRREPARLVEGRRVLVTGAGGTIGAELARQIAALKPAHLALVDHGEYSLYEIDLELSERHAGLARTPYLADIRDRRRLAEIFAADRPDLVFHAAALKHVPMVEANPVEGVLTNAVGTRNVAEACREAGVAAMVLISTDKAVHPTNVMGATKRIAEQVCQALDLARSDGGRATRYITVRFGNVLGSTGSVVPLFRRQLEAGGPLTVTDPEVTRYFMTVREAVELVLQAARLAGSAHRPAGLDEGGIFVLEMGEPVKIADLARQMIRLAGLVPDRDVAIRYVGLRPGEKLTETLFHEAEPPARTACPGVLLARPRAADYAILSRLIDELEQAARDRNQDRTLALVQRLVPEFQGYVPERGEARQSGG